MRLTAFFSAPHWRKPYPHRIAPAVAMVINVGVKKWVVAFWNRCVEASIQKAHNWPSTQLTEATSCVEKLNVTIKAKDLSYISSYQMLTVD